MIKRRFLRRVFCRRGPEDPSPTKHDWCHAVNVCQYLTLTLTAQTKHVNNLLWGTMRTLDVPNSDGSFMEKGTARAAGQSSFFFVGIHVKRHLLVLLWTSAGFILSLSIGHLTLCRPPLLLIFLNHLYFFTWAFFRQRTILRI
jgi:hypothetical protein